MESSGKCKRCGHCCINATFSLPLSEKKTVENLNDLSEWLSYHSCNLLVKEEAETTKLYVSVPIVCKYLKLDKPGTYTCMMYEVRPDMCKNFNCSEKNHE